MFCVEMIKSCCRMSVGLKSDLGSGLWNDEIQSSLCGIDVGLLSGGMMRKKGGKNEKRGKLMNKGS